MRCVPFLALLLLLALAPLARADTITLAADLWCPYNCDPKAARPGFLVEIARTLLEEQGHRLIYEVRPWKRALAEAARGEINGVIGAAPDEAPGFVFPECLMIPSSTLFYVRADSGWQFNGEPSLRGKTFGVIAGYSYGPFLDAYMAAHPDQFLASTDDDASRINLRNLLRSRLDVVLDDAHVATYLAREGGFLHRIKPAGQAEDVDVGLAFSPALPGAGKLAGDLCAGLERMRAAGRLAEILARYGVMDWK